MYLKNWSKNFIEKSLFLPIEYTNLLREDWEKLKCFIWKIFFYIEPLIICMVLQKVDQITF